MAGFGESQRLKLQVAIDRRQRKREGSSGPVSEERKVEVTPELNEPRADLAGALRRSLRAVALARRKGGDAARALKALNAATIAEMHRAFREGGREAILKVMRQQPAVFLKLLILLVPREMDVSHKGGVKSMTDEELERGIEAIQAMLAKRDAGEGAKVIEAVPEPVALPAPSRKPSRKRGAEAKASPLLPDEQGESE
jgi:hypothetical protein